MKLSINDVRYGKDYSTPSTPIKCTIKIRIPPESAKKNRNCDSSSFHICACGASQINYSSKVADLACNRHLNWAPTPENPPTPSRPVPAPARGMTFSSIIQLPALKKTRCNQWPEFGCFMFHSGLNCVRRCTNHPEMFSNIVEGAWRGKRVD